MATVAVNPPEGFYRSLHLGYVIKIGICAASCYFVFEGIARLLNNEFGVTLGLLWEHINLHESGDVLAKKVSVLTLAAVLAFFCEPLVHRAQSVAHAKTGARHTGLRYVFIVLLFSLIVIGMHHELDHVIRHAPKTSSKDFLEMAIVPTVYTLTWMTSRDSFQPKGLTAALWLACAALPVAMGKLYDWEWWETACTLVPCLAIMLFSGTSFVGEWNSETTNVAGFMLTVVAVVFLGIALLAGAFGVWYVWTVWDFSIYLGWGLSMLLMPGPYTGPGYYLPSH